MKRSNLRGRGGAGLSDRRRNWTAPATRRARERYIVCNADEGEPGTFKDRVLLTARAGRVLEGMAIAGYAVGATKGFIYLRGEYEYLQRASCERELDDMRAERPARAPPSAARAGLRFRHRDPHGRRRLRLRRRHGADRIARGQARPAARPAAVPWSSAAISASRPWSTTSRRSRHATEIADRGRRALRQARHARPRPAPSCSPSPATASGRASTNTSSASRSRRVLEDCGAQAPSRGADRRRRRACW